LTSKSSGLIALKFGLDKDESSAGGENRSCKFPFLGPDLEAKISLVHRFECLLGSVLMIALGGMELSPSFLVD
jgi:hypothetical protein